VIAIIVRWEDLSTTRDNAIDVWDEVCHEPPPTISVHYHDYYEINFIQEGSGTYYFGNKQYHISPGQVFVINDREPHYAYGIRAAALK
jgi:mannose-6-phosphate isomerase-like protein (cupin superfamily)